VGALCVLVKSRNQDQKEIWVPDELLTPGRPGPSLLASLSLSFPRRQQMSLSSWIFSDFHTQIHSPEVG
jgi:hypothetical protein